MAPVRRFSGDEGAWPTHVTYPVHRARRREPHVPVPADKVDGLAAFSKVWETTGGDDSFGIVEPR